MQRIVLLGVTGSLGDQTLDIIERYRDRFQIASMSARSNAEKLLERADQFGTEKIFLSAVRIDDSRQIQKMDDLVDHRIDHLMVVDHDLESFQTVLKAVTLKKRVSIANKELIVAHGEDIMYLAREQQAEVIPLDSEHNAIFQCLRGEKISDVRRIIITASGGPFRDRKWEDLKDVTVEEVLKHPTWKMGVKTTVDSATLVNKAFEVIEVHHLFGIPYEKIEVRLHPESIVHAIVEFTDGNQKMLSYKPDMRFSLGYALFFPDRAPEPLAREETKSFDFDRDLHFYSLETGMYPCFDFVLEMVKNKPESIRKILSNDERAVQDFLQGEIGWNDLYPSLKKGIT